MAIQADPAIVDQLNHIATTQTIIAISLAIVALAILGVAVGALLAVRKVTGLLDRTINSVTEPVQNLLGTVDDVNTRLRAAVDAVDVRIKRFGAVVDVVQDEAEEMLIDATSTAKGLHAARQALKRPGKDNDDDGR
jgi:uncharacterized protein YoxC